MVTHSSILAMEVPWTEEPGELLSMGSQKSRAQLTDKTTTEKKKEKKKNRSRNKTREDGGWGELTKVALMETLNLCQSLRSLLLLFLRLHFIKTRSWARCPPDCWANMLLCYCYH